MKRILVIALFCFAALSSYAQQDPLFTQYMFNPVVVNPGYTGSREVISGVLLYRHQWVGYKGAPVTQTFSAHAPLKRQKIAVGMQLIHDEIGPKKTMGYFLSYAYRLKLNRGKLSLGLRTGIYDYRYNWDMIDYRDDNDKFNSMGVTKTIVPNFDFGAYYYTKKEYGGLAFSHIGNPRGFSNNDSSYIAKLFMHFTLTAGKAFVLNDDVTFRPSIIIRNSGMAKADADLNFSFLIRNTLWLGLAARTNLGAMALIEYNITPNLRAGYSYDMNFNRLRSTNSGSHELFIGYDFDIHRSKIMSPRYF
jgi:type IX secretion system PorP/SprF family membrane protein